MSKITNALLLLKLLSNGKVYSTKELSDELGVTERMIRYYKEELEQSGYIIESFKGPGGGYYINKTDHINVNYFNKYDLELLDKIEDILNDTNNPLKDNFASLNNKLHSIYNTNKVLAEYSSNISLTNEDEKIKVISKSIKNKKTIEISYSGVSGKVTTRKIIPINMFLFENDIYVTAFCKLRGAIRHFTLSKILSVKEIQ